MLEPTPQQIARFNEDGFLVVDRFIDPARAAAVAERFERIFRGEFETTVPPDEWRWAEGRDPDDVTRQAWNAWKSDLTLARLALDEQVGLWCARLGGFSGTRLNQDGCMWKPPGATGLAFHQDGNYIEWVRPQLMVTCWIALDDVGEGSGSIEYVRGSHLWGSGARPDAFHAPDDHRAGARQAALALGKPFDVVSVNVPRGGCAFHGTWTWHGSGPNTSGEHRRALALHCMSAEAQFTPDKQAFAQGRFRIFGEGTMHESFYPITFRENGRPSAFIETYLQSRVRHGYRTHYWLGK
jgi:phytanoyl-CoA hydroxylase